MITEHDYWMGRDVAYPAEFDDQIQFSGRSTVMHVNQLLNLFTAATGIAMSVVASGWRPIEVNDATSNAAEHSHHIDATACDIRDTANRDLARWCAKNQDKLAMVGLWCERFEWTPDWVHFQLEPPKSGKRFFIPSTAPAKCVRLPEQDQFNC